MSKTAAALVVVVMGAGAAVGGYLYGHHQGVTAESAKRDGQAVADLTSLINENKGLVKAAGAASVALRQATAMRSKQDDRFTQEFNDALEASAASRAGCVFPTDVMRQLTAARDRAAEAAASGIRRAVPAATSGAAGQRGD